MCAHVYTKYTARFLSLLVAVKKQVPPPVPPPVDSITASTAPPEKSDTSKLQPSSAPVDESKKNR